MPHYPKAKRKKGRFFGALIGVPLVILGLVLSILNLMDTPRLIYLAMAGCFFSFLEVEWDEGKKGIHIRLEAEWDD